MVESVHMTKGRPKIPLNLSDKEREILEQASRRRTKANQDVTRAKMILLSADGVTNREIARKLGLSEGTIGSWRKRFLESRLEGLIDLPRSGRPRTIGDDQVAEVIRLTLETKPENATHWSTRSMAARVGFSNERISHIWRIFGLQPHRVGSFQISTDPEFVEKVHDVAGIYLSPPQNALVLCVDEKSQIQALERSQPILPLRPGQPERHTTDYFRHGTTTLFAALNVATGEVYGQCHKRHSQNELLEFFRHLERETPGQLDLHVIMDNYATHKTERVRQWLVRHPRWHIHFIPTHSSWLNQVERFFAKITNDMIRRGNFRSVADLKAAIFEYLEKHNKDPRPFRWTATPEAILSKVENICKKLS